MKYFSKVQPFFLPTLFLLLFVIVASSLLALEQPLIAQAGYVVFLCLVGLSYFIENNRVKVGATLISVSILVVIGFIFPLDIEELEEIYLFIPFLYLMISPGSFLPIPIGLALILAYLPSLETTLIEDFAEDALEMLVISSFATIMTYFQQRSYHQMRDFRRESFTDYLTRLPNRKKFLEYIEFLRQDILYRKKQGQPFALLMIDLDGFKKINDQLGHLAGDQVLKMVANRLDYITNDYCTAFRIGGDEFAFVITQDVCLQVEAIALSKKVLRLSNNPYRIYEKNYLVTASIGISFFPDDACELENLCSNADMAMYAAKRDGKNTFSCYNDELKSKALRKYELENDLKLAIAKGELFVLYQPKVCLKTGKVKTAEALVRWQHAKYGLISPVEFIAIAEESSFIIELGNWVLKETCKQIVLWREKYDIERIAVNVSSVQLACPDFHFTVCKILADTGCSSSWIEIEQTESWIMENPGDNISVLERLKDVGVLLSLDDFGTAYSSLSQVGRLPLDVLKIDKSFIDNCVENSRDHMIVRTIIQLGQNLGMKIVAEGVEFESQKQLLQKEGCDYYQGFLFSKPVVADIFEKYLTKTHSSTLTTL